MADNPNDDDLEDLEDEDDEFTKVARAALESAMGDEDETDDGGLDQPMTEAADSTVVSHDQGTKLLDDARDQALKPKVDAKPAEKPDSPDAAAKPADDAAKAPDDAGAEAKPSDAQQAKPADLDALLDGIPDDRKAEITKRIAEANPLTGLFAGREDTLKADKTTPEAVVQQFLGLADFAREKPDEYLAWVASQAGGDKAHEVMGRAAAMLGYKLVPNESAPVIDPADAEDEFDDEETKARKARNRTLATENAQLKAAKEPVKEFGPFTTANVVQQQLASFENERGADGTLKRPLFGALKPQVAAMATRHRAATNAPPTMADLDRFYAEAETKFMTERGITRISAAQKPAPVADKTQEQEAARLAKAKAASKSLDGSGQGAPRQPGLAANATIAETIRHVLGNT